MSELSDYFNNALPTELDVEEKFPKLKNEIKTLEKNTFEFQTMVKPTKGMDPE